MTFGEQAFAGGVAHMVARRLLSVSHSFQGGEAEFSLLLKNAFEQTWE